MSFAAVSGAVTVLIPLFAVYRTQQRPLAFAVAERVEVFAGGQTITQGVQDRGLTDAIHTDQIRDLPDIQNIIGKIMPVDQPQAVQRYHTSSSSLVF